MVSTFPITRKWIVPASGTATIAEILDNAEYLWVTDVSIRASRDNAGDVFWKDAAGGQQGGYIGPGEAALMGDLYGSRQMMFYELSGTEGDVLFATIGISPRT